MNAQISQSNRGSIFNLDYVSGGELAKMEGFADDFLNIMQACTELDTVTGVLPDLNMRYFNPDNYADVKGIWDIEQPDLIDVLKKAKSGKPNDRVAPRDCYEPLQEWEGYVVQVNDGDFVARLLDITAQADRETEQAVFSISDVSDDDRALLKVGAIFRWSVGYEKKVSGTRRKISSIVFRRLPTWSRIEIDEARARANNLLESIEWT